MYEEKLQDREALREDQLLLSKATRKPNKYEEGSSHGRGRGQGWRGGQGRGRGDSKQHEHGDEAIPQDKSKVNYCVCKKLGDFAYECTQRKKDEKVQVVEVEEKSQPTLRMVIIETSKVSLLHGVNEKEMNKSMWYLDNRARNRVIGDLLLFQELNKLLQGIVRFGD